MTATRLVCGVALLLAQLAPALAEDGCDKFAWPLTRERALLAAADKAVAKAGDTLAAMPKGAMALQLAPGADASFVMPPERKSRVEPWFGSAIKFAAPDKPGIYQVTLSEDAWLDIVQDGRYARSVGSTGRGDCPGLRKSVRLELTAAPFVLQFSGVAADKIFVTIGPRD
jgi:hypothetical protein